MGEIIASQLNLDGQVFTGAIVLCALLSTCATYAFFKNEFKKNYHRDDIVAGVCTLVLTVVLIIGAYTSINRSQVQQNEYNSIKQATGKVPYYDLKKDGVLIVAEKEPDAPEWLVNKVETKIVGEDDTTYQVQFKEKYARIKKKDLK